MSKYHMFSNFVKGNIFDSILTGHENSTDSYAQEILSGWHLLACFHFNPVLFFQNLSKRNISSVLVLLRVSVPDTLQRILVEKLFFFIWCRGGGGVNWVYSALRPPIGLLCQPLVIMIMENLVEWLAGETEVLGENLPQLRFVHHKLHMLPGREPGKSTTNRLSYGTSLVEYNSRSMSFCRYNVKKKVKLFPCLTN
jgi:hypothetical protein